jgi:hypothetical protein
LCYEQEGKPMSQKKKTASAAAPRARRARHDRLLRAGDPHETHNGAMLAIPARRKRAGACPLLVLDGSLICLYETAKSAIRSSY